MLGRTLRGEDGTQSRRRADHTRRFKVSAGMEKNQALNSPEGFLEEVQSVPVSLKEEKVSTRVQRQKPSGVKGGVSKRSRMGDSGLVVRTQVWGHSSSNQNKQG